MSADVQQKQSEAAREYWSNLTPDEREKRAAANRRPAAEKAANALAEKRAVAEERIRAIAERCPVTEHSLLLVGYRVRRRRATIMSQLELADAIGVDERTVSLIERGRFLALTPAILAAVCVELELQPEDVLS